MQSDNHHPIAIIEDRYNGLYSGGKWLAISRADDLENGAYRADDLENGAYRIVRCLEDGPHGDDLDAQDFWSNPPAWIASADTPDGAVQKLQTPGTKSSTA